MRAHVRNKNEMTVEERGKKGRPRTGKGKQGSRSNGNRHGECTVSNELVRPRGSFHNKYETVEISLTQTTTFPSQDG